MSGRGFAATTVLAIGLAASAAWAQQQGRRQFDPQQMRQRMMERMQEQLGVNAEEWQAVQPLLENVMTAQRNMGAGMGRFGMMRGRRRDRGGEPGGPGRAGPGGREPMPEVEALQAALDNEDTPAPELKEKLDALRAVRKKNEVALKEARDELRKVLSVRQEALLVLRGILD
jgi:hypothetical protein